MFWAFYEHINNTINTVFIFAKSKINMKILPKFELKMKILPKLKLKMKILPKLKLKIKFRSKKLKKREKNGDEKFWNFFLICVVTKIFFAHVTKRRGSAYVTFIFFGRTIFFVKNRSWNWKKFWNFWIFWSWKNFEIFEIEKFWEKKFFYRFSCLFWFCNTLSPRIRLRCNCNQSTCN